MSSLTSHDVEQLKLEGEKFDFLLHCKTCGWEARGFDSFGAKADDLKKGHIGARAAYAAGDPDYTFGHMKNAPVPVLEEAKALSEKKKAIEDAAAGLPKDGSVMSPLTTDQQIALAEQFRKIDEDSAKQKASALDAAEKAAGGKNPDSGNVAPAPASSGQHSKETKSKGWG